MSESLQVSEQKLRRFKITQRGIAIVMVTLCVVLLLVWRFTCLSHTRCVGTATLTYKSGREIVSVKLDYTDWMEISSILDLNLLSENRWRCIVNENLSIKWGFTTYYIAQDGCDLVHLAGTDQCFETGKRDRLWEILEKYGAHMG